ncbi:hypothetical protein [Photobacterium kagoshimensis]|uniref:hypothetical protein n=1 Tax=Photobacterium kagoshimensis TaxID=2910242 RepID=UPI003D12B85A
MPLLLSPLVLKVGTESDKGKLFGCENIVPKWVESDSYTGRAHLTISDLSLNYITRLTYLFKACAGCFPEDWQSLPIIFLTPAFSSKEHTKVLFNSYCKALPLLSEHKQLFFYPYGRAASLLAIKQIEQLLSGNNTSRVLIVGVDSHHKLCPTSQEACDSHYEESHITACDSMAVIQVEFSEQGLVTHWHGKSAQAKVNEKGQGVANLFYMLNKQSDLSIDAIHLPLNNTTKMANEWLEQLPGIASLLSSELKCLFNGIRVGDLGTTMGIFNLLHTQSLYQNGELETDQAILQLDLSDGLYQSAVLFGWQNEISDAA